MGSLTAQALGNITSDIELKTIQTGTNTAQWTVAVNHGKDQTSFVRCAAWGRTAEIISSSLGKGDPIFVNGTAKINEWTDKSGNKRNDFEIQVRDFSFVTSKSNERPIAQHEVLEKARDTVIDDDRPIDLSEIPF